MTEKTHKWKEEWGVFMMIRFLDHHNMNMSITVCVDECQRGENVSIKSLRHELEQVSRLAKRAMEIISAFEPVEETARSEHTDPCPTCGVDAKTVTIGSSCECEATP